MIAARVQPILSIHTRYAAVLPVTVCLFMWTLGASQVDRNRVDAAEISVQTNSSSGGKVYELRQGNTVAKFAPAAGANLFSIKVDGVEYLRQPPAMEDLPGVRYGVPILYPTPNRIRDAQFTFANRQVQFEPNAGPNFIHGLVNRVEWEVTSMQADAQVAVVRCTLSFEKGTPLFAKFPFAHRLNLTISVSDGAVTWEYTVDNRRGDQAVPFGFALHPYFLYQNDRSSTYLTIPATHWMESDNQLPSGELVAAAKLDYPLDEPMSLEGRRFDDVFWGIRPERPTVIDFRDTGRKIVIEASPEFTHLVVWTPASPYFGIESQTCSTDAHNLYSQGFREAAHLQICNAGEVNTGRVTYRFTSSRK